MAKSITVTSIRDWFAYWIQWAMLEVWGPATQDRATDPILMLKRRYGRPIPPVQHL